MPHTSDKIWRKLCLPEPCTTIQSETVVFQVIACQANQTHFNLNGFALRLVLKQRHKETGKWPIKIIAKQNFEQGFSMAVPHICKPYS